MKNIFQRIILIIRVIGYVLYQKLFAKRNKKRCIFCEEDSQNWNEFSSRI